MDPVRSRSNNKEWFYLPKSEVWGVFVEVIDNTNLKYHALKEPYRPPQVELIRRGLRGQHFGWSGISRFRKWVRTLDKM